MKIIYGNLRGENIQVHYPTCAAVYEIRRKRRF